MRSSQRPREFHCQNSVRRNIVTLVLIAFAISPQLQICCLSIYTHIQYENGRNTGECSIAWLDFSS